MLTSFLVAYVAGQIFTAVVLLSSERMKHDRLMNAVSILLWPLYWSYFLTLVILNRKRS